MAVGEKPVRDQYLIAAVCTCSGWTTPRPKAAASFVKNHSVRVVDHSKLERKGKNEKPEAA